MFFVDIVGAKFHCAHHAGTICYHGRTQGSVQLMQEGRESCHLSEPIIKGEKQENDIKPVSRLTWTSKEALLMTPAN